MIDLRCRRRLAEVLPVCRSGTERRWSAVPEPATHRPASAESSVARTSTPGLLIRVEISKGPPRAPVRRRLSRGTLLLILGGAVAVLLGWVAISVFRTEPTSAPAATEGAPNSESQSLAPAPEPKIGRASCRER